MTFMDMSQCMHRLRNRDDKYQVVEEFEPGCFADLIATDYPNKIMVNNPNRSGKWWL